MKLKSIIIIFILFISCQENNKIIDEAILKAQNYFSENEIKDFAKKNESYVDFFYQMNFRNKYIRSPKDSSLVKYFNSLGVYHEDDMSGIIFKSLHRKLNGKKINIEQQVEFIKKYDEAEKIKENVNTKRALKYYKKVEVGDTILTKMYVDQNTNNAVRYLYPEDVGRDFDNSLDLLITGVLIRKEPIIDTLDIKNDIRIISLNHKTIKVLGEYINVNDTLKVDFRHDIIETIDR